MKFPYPDSIGRRWLRTLLFCLAPLIAAAPAPADSPERTEPPASILFVGNSFTFFNNAIYTHLSEAAMFAAIGTSGNVYPAAGFPVVAKRNGSKLVILNREPTDLDGFADLVINDEIGPVLSAVVGLD